MKILIAILPALLCLWLSGCTPASTREALDHAGTLMAPAPDSALTILDAIDPATLRSDSRKAEYALLLTQARHKSYLPLEDDSLINMAVDLYSVSDKNGGLMKSLYYQGVTYYTLGNYGKSVKAAMRSRELAINSEDNEWQARASELLADVMNHAYLWDEAIAYSSEAVEHYALAGKTRNHRFALCDFGMNYCNSNNSEYKSRGISIIDSILDVASKEPADTLLMVYCYSSLMPIYIEVGRFVEADTVFNAIKALEGSYPLESLTYSGKGAIEYSKGNIDAAFKYFSIADSISTTSSDSATVLCNYIDLYESIGNSTELGKCLRRLLKIQNNAVAERLVQPVSSAQRDYYHENVLSERHRVKWMKRSIMIGSLVSLAIIILMYIVYRQRMRIKNIELEYRNDRLIDLAEQVKSHLSNNEKLSFEIDKRQSEILRLSDMLSVEHNNMIELKDSIEGLMRSRWETLNRLCNEYFEKKDSDATRISIVNDIESEIKKLRSPKSFINIELEVNRYMSNIVKRLRMQCPKLKSEDIVFITLIYAGFNPRTVCLLTDIKLKYFYAKRSRLSERILASEAKDRAEFIAKLR